MPPILRNVGLPGRAHLGVWEKVPRVPIPYGGNLPLSNHLLEAEGYGLGATSPKTRIGPQCVLKSIGSLDAPYTQVAVAVGPPHLGRDKELGIGNVLQDPSQIVLRLLLERLISFLPSYMTQHAVQG